MEVADYDFLDKCTKEELIFHIRREGWLRQSFKYSDVLFSRWQKRSEELRKLQKTHSEKLDTFDSKAQDDLARQFDAQKNIHKKLEIAKRMKPYELNMQKWWKDEKRLQKEDKKLETLYESIDIQRKKER